MKFEFYLMLIAFSTAVSCAKADKKTESDTTSEGKPAHGVGSKPQPSFPNF
jgi:hypothetical protein